MPRVFIFTLIHHHICFYFYLIIDETFVGIKQQQDHGSYGSVHRLEARAQGKMPGPGEARVISANGEVTFKVSGWDELCVISVSFLSKLYL